MTAAACLLAPLLAQAQHWSFQEFGASTGLTNPTILALQQDAQGFLWVSTEGGLFRYDGDWFRSYEARSDSKVAIVSGLYTSSDLQLWASSSSGLFRWAGASFRPVEGFDNLELEGSQALASDAQHLYAATSTGLWSIPLSDGTRPRHLTTTATASVLVDRHSNIWFGCGTSLCRLHDGVSSELTGDPVLRAGPWQTMVEDSAGHLWLRSADQVVAQDAPSGAFRRITTVTATHRVTLSAGRDGEVLVPHGEGLAICKIQGCRNYDTSNGLQHSEVTAVIEDREGSLWLGYAGRGLARWRGREEWQSFAEGEGLTDPQIWRLVRDSAGSLWVGTGRGLFRGSNRDGHWQFTRSDVLGNGTVYGLLADPDGSLWMGTSRSGPSGLVHYDPRTGKKAFYAPAQPPAHFAVDGLSRDPGGAIWVVSSKQLFRLQPGSAHLEVVSVPVSGSRIFQVLHAAGGFYVTGKKGLYVERPGVHRLLTMADGLKDNAIQSVAVSSSGEVWVAYYAALGLSKITWMGKYFAIQHYSAVAGLPGNLVYSQLFDAHGQHWIGTDSGVAVFRHNHWDRYDTSTGLISNDCNAEALLAQPDGTVWVGTSSGLSRFFPARLAVPPLPSALVTSVLRNDVVTESGTFDSSTRTVSMRFTMLSYKHEGQLFRYRLGDAHPWVQTRAREVHFAELPPGRYHFQVQGEFAPNAWSTPAHRYFVIQSPWFRSKLFLVTASSLLVALIWLGLRRREAHQRKIRADLEEAVAERTRGLAAATARAEQESRFKGQFLANMSHEMRTPLNGVLGLTKLALECSNQPEVVSHLSTVQFSAKVLLSLINDVLDLAKLEAGMLEIVPVAFAPRPLVNEVCAMLQAEVQTKGLLLQVSFSSHVPDWVLSDDCRVRQVLVNLIGNAIKFTAQGSVTVSVQYDGTRLRFTVSDTGIGVTPAQQAIIFDTFRQADSSTSRSHGGTGLGLAISRKLVEWMGGTILVESEINRGSTFSFDIPAAQTVAPQVQPSFGSAVDVRSLRILAAEDNKVNQHLLLALLRKRGHSCVIANDGREAISAYQRENFDLILMDIQMPEMDGFEAVRLIREAEMFTGARTPVVAVTARAMPGDRDQILAAGMDDYLDKPIQTERLDAILSRFASVDTRVASVTSEFVT